MESEKISIDDLLKYIVNIQILTEMERGYYSFCHTGHGEELDYEKQNLFFHTAHRLEMENFEILSDCLSNEKILEYFEHCMHNFIEMHDPETKMSYLVPDKENSEELFNSPHWIKLHTGHGIMSCLETVYENSLSKKKEHKNNMKSKFTRVK